MLSTLRDKCCIQLVMCLFIVSMYECFSGTSGSCPSLCTCKWKGGKQTVECAERGLITIPESADMETQVMNLSDNNIQILSAENFKRSGLLNLQRVYLRNCRLGQIDDVAFKGLTNLVELDLSHNLLTSIPTAAFNDTPFLRELVISNNPIQKIDAEAFKGLRNLIKLDLSNCAIQTISPRAFKGVEMLESLKLDGNSLSELRPHTIEVLNKLHEVTLHDNPWHCDCRLRLIKEWLVVQNIPQPVPAVCNGGPERIIHKSFAELQMDDFACKPEILPVNRHIQTSVGQNATLTCRANAIPPAHIRWYWNGKLLANHSAFSAHQRIYISESGKHDKTSSLVLTKVNDADSTEFYCRAENRAGSSEANYTLRVESDSLGFSSLGNGQIAGFSITLIILIICIILLVPSLLVRLRRTPVVESKTPTQTEAIALNGTVASTAKASISPIDSPDEVPPSPEQKHPTEIQFCNPVQKPPRLNDLPYPTTHYGGSMLSVSFASPSSNSGNNPDLINDAKVCNDEPLSVAVVNEDAASVLRRASGEYSRNVDSLYPSGMWDEIDTYSRQVAGVAAGLSYNDKTPIIEERTSASGSVEELRFRTLQGANRVMGYPQDYGLPMGSYRTEQVSSKSMQVSLPANARTLRVWQKGAVPVLPPVTALKRALSSSRNSPDEGYQEGCGTDV